ncbi:MAG: DUF5107 domain-containing protein [Fimbriimonadaceae bacterium]|nr:DUF5107 domain-containing protein [Fimbriimonadaceae bacterium]
MATEIFEDAIELEAGTLEAIYPTPENLGLCYPYPQLRVAGRTAGMSFRTLTLENPYLRVTVVPDLGGRILSFFDKRTETEILPQPKPLSAASGGPRGAELTAGILVDIGTAGRMNAMGPVEYQIRDQVEEDESPYLILHELVAGLGVSWHATLTLPPDRAELHLSVKVQNRQLLPVHCKQGLLAWLSESSQALSQANSSVVFSPDLNCGLGLHYADAFFESVEAIEGRLRLNRSAEHELLLPRQSDTWTVVLQPVSKLSSLEAWSSEAAICLNEGKLSVQSVAPRAGAKLLVGTEAGESFEAAVDLYPEKSTTLDIASMPLLAAIAIRDSDKNDLLVADLSSPPNQLSAKPLGLASPSAALNAFAKPDPGSREALVLAGITDKNPESTILGLNIPGLQSVCRLSLALEALRQKRHEEALVWLEDAISYNAEDHLIWWLKATVKRIHGLEEEEDQDLPTAHFLAPLEPALRAESFLRQPQTHGKEPNPIIKPLANHPEAMIEVACLLLEAGLDEEAMRWMDEARRHRDEPMLRYLQAWSLLSKTRMAVEAADLVLGASGKPLEPPYPWRPIEKTAIRELSARFSDDPRLSQLHRMLGS